MCVTKPRLCFVGPMIGRLGGNVTTQGERLADLFAGLGYPVVSVSSRRNRYARAAEMAATMLLRQRSIDIAVLQVFSGPSFTVARIASRLARAAGLPVVMVLRGGDLPALFERQAGVAKRLLARADAIVAPSEYLARAAGRLGFETVRIPNVIDLAAYPYRLRDLAPPRLLWMRSFHAVYNPGLAVRVLADLRRVQPEVSMVMAGPDKGLLRETQQLAQSLGVADAIRFEGFLDMPAKIREMSAAGIYLHTNRVDNTPVSVIEAWAMGLPVAATRVGGIPDLVQDGETGLLVPGDDPAAMTQAVLRLLTDGALVGRLSANGRQAAGRCSASEVLPQWQRLLSGLAPAR